MLCFRKSAQLIPNKPSLRLGSHVQKPFTMNALVEKEGILRGVIKWDELMKVDPNQRGVLLVEQMPSLNRFQSIKIESILEANKIMIREKNGNLIPACPIEKCPLRVVGVLTTQAPANAIMKKLEPV